MKSLFKLLSLFLALSLFAASCNNSTSEESESDTSSVIDSMPEDNSASGDTAVVIDSIE